MNDGGARFSSFGSTWDWVFPTLPIFLGMDNEDPNEEAGN